MLMFTKDIHKVVFFFYGHNSNKKRKKRKILFFSFSFEFIFFFGVVKMNDCIKFHFQDLSTAVAIATAYCTSSVYFSLHSKGNKSLLIRVIASRKEIIMSQTTIMHTDLLYHGHTLYFQNAHIWYRVLRKKT